MTRVENVRGAEKRLGVYSKIIKNAKINPNPDMKYTSISAVFPAYNEEKNIETTITSANTILQKYFSRYEIIVVDDGSADATLIILGRLREKYPQLKIITHIHNLGYGATIRDGLSSATGELVFFSDADNQFDLNEIKLLLDEIDDHDAVVGYRKQRKDSLPRLIYARLWNALNKIIFKIPFKDINCAFKLFTKKILDDIDVKNLKAHGAAISPEIFVKLIRSKAKIKEVPVNHFPRHHGKQTGANPRVILRAFFEIIELYRSIKL